MSYENVHLVERSRSTTHATNLPPSPPSSTRGSLSPYGYGSNTDFTYQGQHASRSPDAGERYSQAYAFRDEDIKNYGSTGSLANDAYKTVRATLSEWCNRGHTLEQRPAKPKLHRTSYLDGLRGFGAFLVYILHNEGWAHSTTPEQARRLEVGWGFNGQYDFVTFPLIRTFFTGGHLAVATFLVISGYVLAAKPLSLMQSKETVGLAENLCSALFRRWMRLFLPVATLTFLWMTSWHLLGIRSSSPITPERTYFDEMWKWYCDFKNYSFIFNDSYFNAYSFHAWTIPLEFRGSIVIYTTCIALSRCDTVSRLRAECGLIFYFIYIVDGWYCALFCIGMLLSDIDLLAMKHQLPRSLHCLRSQPSWVYYTMLLIALFVGGVTSLGNDMTDLRNTPGWYLLSFLPPQAMLNYAWFFRIIAATLLMICIPRIRWLQAFFETRFCQYLGKISFGLYLVHGPLLWTIGDRIYAAVGLVREAHHGLVPWWVNRYPFPNKGPYGLEFNFLVAQLVLLPLNLWVAEMFTQYVDEPSVRFAQWLLKHHISIDRGFVV